VPPGVVAAVGNGLGDAEGGVEVSQENTIKDSVKSRKVAILAADGVSYSELMPMKEALTAEGAHAEVVSKNGGTLKSADGEEVPVDKIYVTTGSIMYDAVFVPGGRQSATTLSTQGDALHFVNEAFKHGKAIAATGEGITLLQAAQLNGVAIDEGDAPRRGDCTVDQGVVSARSSSATEAVTRQFIRALAQHRHWGRQSKDQVPA
jgi:catalase